MRALKAAILLTLFGLGSAAAQQPTASQTAAIRQYCASDFRAHCASVPTGGKTALACLQQNASSLSASCQQAVAAVSGGSSSPMPATAPPPMQQPPMSPRQKAAMMRQACGTDYRQFCTGIRPGGGAALGCLESHAPSLSSQCRGVLASARGG